MDEPYEVSAGREIFIRRQPIRLEDQAHDRPIKCLHCINCHKLGVGHTKQACRIVTSDCPVRGEEALPRMLLALQAT